MNVRGSGEEGRKSGLEDWWGKGSSNLECELIRSYEVMFSLRKWQKRQKSDMDGCAEWMGRWKNIEEGWCGSF